MKTMNPLAAAGMILLSTLANSTVATAQEGINKNLPPFSLTLAQAEQWTTTSKLADERNISQVPLASRFSAPLNAEQEQLDRRVKVLIAPDGMNNFGNYLGEQDTFNLYNFTQWSNIDVLNWFAGTADQTVNLPAKPWVEAAHRNGVKVIGSVFLGVARWGGSADTAQKLLSQDEQGRFIFADKLIAMAEYYGFDGWLINQETDLSAVKDADNNFVEGEKDPERAKQLAIKMQEFTKYLTQNAPAGMEIHWYDAMIMTGEVKWQNELNDKNLMFIREPDSISGEGKDGRVSDAMFLNYWWDDKMALESNEYAVKNQVNPYEIYYGADLWPERTAQKMFTETDWLHALFPKNLQSGLGSIAVFGINANYNFPGTEEVAPYSTFQKDETDVYRFYDSQTRFFSGDDLNVAIHDDIVDNSKAWPGLGRYVPAKSTINDLPFTTTFNTGHGKAKYQQGEVVATQWHDISQQDILPTWQFAVFGEGVIKPFFDFEQAYNGGNSLGFRLEKGTVSARIPLYKTQLTLSKQSSLKLVTTSTANVTAKTYVCLQMASGEHVKLFIEPNQNKANTWQSQTFSLSDYAGQDVIKMGVSFEGDVIDNSQFNLGRIEIN